VRSLSVAVVLALAAAPIAVQAQDGSAALRTTPDDPAASVVLTPQGIRRQTVEPSSGKPTPTNLDAAQRPLLGARPSLMELVKSLACTSMFARRPETQGTDPAASAGR